MTVMYYKNASDAREEEVTREYVGLTAKLMAEPDNYRHGPKYPEEWLDNSAGSSKRQRWINWLRYYGFID